MRSRLTRAAKFVRGDNAVDGPNTAIGKLASSLGSVFGKTGGSIGGEVGDIFSKVMGFGAYEVKENTIATELQTGAQVPVMHSSKDSFIVRHREYIGDVNSSVNFANTPFAINPGLNSSFPWLSTLAQNFTQYRFLGLMFEYRTTSANSIASVNPALGAICLATDYNVYSPVFTSKQQVDNNMWTTSARPCDSFLHPIECAPMMNANNVYFVRSGAVPSGQDRRLYDLGTLQVVAAGSQSANVVGELWATYEVELIKPQLQGALGSNVEGAFYTLHPLTSGNTFFDNASPVQKYDSLGIQFDPDGQFITIPAGNIGFYRVRLYAYANSFSSGNPWFTYGNTTNLTTYNVYPDQSGPLTQSLVTYWTDAQYMSEFVFNITNPQLPCNIGAGSLSWSGAMYAQLTIEQLPVQYSNFAPGSIFTLANSLAPVSHSVQVEEEKEDQTIEPLVMVPNNQSRVITVEKRLGK